jgi:L-threonylcarbamoyladenylate synthase
MVSFEEDIKKCLKVLEEGGTILYPTDTLWGIGCDATNEAAVEQIIQLKQRPAHKSFVVLVADERQVMQYTAAVDLAVFDYLAAAAKPTTVIYQGAIGLAENVLADNGSVAIRICRDEFCRHLIKRFRKPIVSTSANISGQPPQGIYGDIDTRIKNGVNYVVEHRRDEITGNQPSAIIEWTNGNIKIIRE